MLLTLLKNGVTQDEIVSIRPWEITSDGVKVGDKVIEINPPNFAEYLNENNKLIQKYKFLFPGKTQPQMKSDTIAVTINKLCKKNECKPADIGIETVKRTYRKAKSNFSMLEFAAMYQKLK